MAEGLAEVLTRWRRAAPYNGDTDYLFASPNKHGRQPYWPTAAMEDYIWPAAHGAGISKRVGWHTFRDTFGTLVNTNGADVATTQALMRRANASITMDRYVYVQAVTAAKRQAQSRIVKLLPFPNVPTRLTDTACNCLNRKHWALNSAVECHLHTVEVIGSNPIAPTIHNRSGPET